MMLWPMLLLACSGSSSDGDSDAVDTDDTDLPLDTIDTGTPVPPPSVISCSEQVSNLLRFDCEVTLDAPSEIVVEVWRSDLDVSQARAFPGEGELSTHVVGVHFLRTESTFEARVVTPDGTELGRTSFQTSDLPGSVGIEATVSGTPTAEGLLVAPNCPAGWAFLFDGEGEIIWYQEIGAMLTGAPTPLTGLSYTEDDTLLVTVGKSVVAEVTWDGEVLLDLRRGLDFDHYLHHDLIRKDGVTWALFATSFDDGSDTWVLDGVYALDASGVIDQFDIIGLFPLVVSPFDTVGYWSGFYPEAHDFSHANSVFVEDDGDLLVSFRHLHAVAQFTGGPGTPGFGDLQWLAVGRPDSPVAPGDLVLQGSADPGFGGQHHATRGSDGALWMMDNGWDFDETARGVRYEVDAVGGTLTELESWETDLVCPIQGAAFERPAGGALLTCASAGWAGEFQAGSPDPVFEMQLSCGGPIPVVVPRVIPIDAL